MKALPKYRSGKNHINWQLKYSILQQGYQGPKIMD